MGKISDRFGHAQATPLPVWGVHVSIYYYPAMAQWWSNAYLTEQEGDRVSTHHDAEMNWGPFDTAHDALDWAHLELDRCMAHPDAPWGSPPR